MVGRPAELAGNNQPSTSREEYLSEQGTWIFTKCRT